MQSVGMIKKSGFFSFPNFVTVYGPGGKDACVFGEDFCDGGLQERGILSVKVQQ